MKRLLLAGVLVSAALVPATALAATGRAGDAVNVAKGQVVKDDFYAAGENVVIAGTVEGDVVAAGSEVTVTGRVTGSVWAAGATVRVTGTVDGSVRAAGSEVSVAGRVGRDVIFFGGTIGIQRNGRVAGDVVGYGQDAAIAGTVGRDVRVGSDTLFVSGTVGGNLKAETGSGFRLADTARVRGDLAYTAPEEFTRSDGAKVGGSVDFTQRQDDHPSFLDRLNGQVFWFLASLLLLLGILLYARRAAVRASTLLTERPGVSLLAGAGFLITTPLLAGILLISLVGLPLSLFTLFGYALVIYSAKVFVTLALGGTIARKLPDRFWPVFGAGAFGLAVYYLLAAIPVVGTVVVIGTAVFGSGAQLLLFKELYDVNKKKYGV